MEYRKVALEEIDRRLFRAFVRRQDVTKCWRKEGGDWVIRDIAFIDDWSEADYAYLVTCLRGTLEGGGVLFGAFEGGVLKGFASVEGRPLGSRADMLDLRACMSRGTGGARAPADGCSPWRRAGPGSTVPVSCTYPPIRRWKPRRFTGPWAAWRRRNTPPITRPRNPATASWNTG